MKKKLWEDLEREEVCNGLACVETSAVLTLLGL